VQYINSDGNMDYKCICEEQTCYQNNNDDKSPCISEGNIDACQNMDCGYGGICVYDPDHPNPSPETYKCKCIGDWKKSQPDTDDNKTGKCDIPPCNSTPIKQDPLYCGKDADNNPIGQCYSRQDTAYCHCYPGYPVNESGKCSTEDACPFGKYGPTCESFIDLCKKISDMTPYEQAVINSQKPWPDWYISATKNGTTDFSGGGGGKCTTVSFPGVAWEKQSPVPIISCKGTTMGRGNAHKSDDHRWLKGTDQANGPNGSIPFYLSGLLSSEISTEDGVKTDDFEDWYAAGRTISDSGQTDKYLQDAIYPCNTTPCSGSGNTFQTGPKNTPHADQEYGTVLPDGGVSCTPCTTDSDKKFEDDGLWKKANGISLARRNCRQLNDTEPVNVKKCGCTLSSSCDKGGGTLGDDGVWKNPGRDCGGCFPAWDRHVCITAGSEEPECP
jgi:hypothetical protein